MKTLNQNGFLQYPGAYRELDSYKKSVVLYDMTYWYINRYLQASDRTFGQMQQAARSGKQNIVEGLEDYMTSRDTGTMNGSQECYRSAVNTAPPKTILRSMKNGIRKRYATRRLRSSIKSIAV